MYFKVLWFIKQSFFILKPSYQLFAMLLHKLSDLLYSKMFYYVILFLPPKDKYTFKFKMEKFWEMRTQYTEIHFSKNIKTHTTFKVPLYFIAILWKTHF